MFVNPIDLKMNEPTQCDHYMQIVVSMMSYKDKVDYAVTYEFSPEQLGSGRHLQMDGKQCVWSS